MSWNKFFHSRFGAAGLKLVGWMRICLGALILIDRICFLPDAEFLLSPSGVLNFLAAQQNPLVSADQLTLFSLFPESEEFFWGLYYLGMVQAVLLMAGILPKFQLACLYVNMVSFQHHNHMMWDGEDRMFKLWYVSSGCFALIALARGARRVDLCSPVVVVVDTVVTPGPFCFYSFPCIR
jgi:hypothetical protein